MIDVFGSPLKGLCWNNLSNGGDNVTEFYLQSLSKRYKVEGRCTAVLGCGTSTLRRSWRASSARADKSICCSSVEAGECFRRRGCRTGRFSGRISRSRTGGASSTSHESWSACSAWYLSSSRTRRRLRDKRGRKHVPTDDHRVDRSSWDCECRKQARKGLRTDCTLPDADSSNPAAWEWIGKDRFFGRASGDGKRTTTSFDNLG